MSSPSSPADGGQALQPVSHNAQRESAMFSPAQHHRERLDFAESASPRDSSVHDKISQFNTLAMQSKQLERKTADAALKRAMLGREEAEADMRRYRDEARTLRKQVEEGKDRERKVGERLEAVMENYGRAKETHAHTQQLWEKEIRRARKETFKVQSALVKVQEELKSCRTAQKAAEDELQSERERSKVREQEAFDAQYRLVGLQEQLDQALARVKTLEQELDAVKTLAKIEPEVKRLASVALGGDSEGPRKRARMSSISAFAGGDPEVETLAMLWEWEKQRADRALDQVDFLEAECKLKICSAGKALRQNNSSRAPSPRRARGSVLNISDAGDSMILSESRRGSLGPSKPTPSRSKTARLRVDKEPRRSTVFLPAEGIFRTVSQAEADAMATTSAASSVVSPTELAASVPITPTDSDPMYRRTPSLDPPDFAVLSKERTSLLSLLDAPHRQDPTPVFNIPTTPGPVNNHAEPEEEAHVPPHNISIPPRNPTASLTAPLTDPLPSHTTTTTTTDTTMPPPPARPHTTASFYPTTTTTTKVPLRSEPQDGPTLAQRLMKMQRTPSRQTGTGEDDADDAEEQAERPSFDATNPALTPTMTREQALAQIRERRGRARSVGRVAAASAAAAAPGTNSTGSGSGGGSAGRKVSGASNSHAAAAESSSNNGGVVRRKASSGGLNGNSGGAGGRRVGSREGASSVATVRGRERDVRREVSAPTTATAATTSGGTVRGAAAAGRRVRS
ncbi:hypothetical protein C8A00DRAFT_16093 [Chaetomidium leptoderma]|uniref:Uncharacterized protein n=1 Tax=Chaetomidium leptoderma TaxID=669021 RepID=A0AAN6ZW89_9PEZI|nr:hypothetical protein C8A00DRAFT_16093 [Chaetomidium leptoderma]